MSASEPAQRATEAGAAKPRPDNLTLRVVSALVLAPLTILIAYLGSWPFVVFWGAAAIGVALEWIRIISDRRDFGSQVAAAVALAAATLATAVGYPGTAGAILVAGAVAVAVLSDDTRRAWAAVGVLYAGAVLLAPAIVRGGNGLGFAALIFLFAVVWATDILGYFSGRLLGGPKLWPRVSPKKTWAGAIGGAIGAVLAGGIVAHLAGLSNLVAVAVLALLMSAVSQAGDLFESAVKRKFGVKDAGQVIPGHGGIMDRLDGFLAAALAAAVIGLVRGGVADPARGLLVW